MDAKRARPVDDPKALVSFGWAPGGYYCAACAACGQSHSGSDKRSSRCQDCAEALRDAAPFKAPSNANTSGLAPTDALRLVPIDMQIESILHDLVEEVSAAQRGARVKARARQCCARGAAKNALLNLLAAAPASPLPGGGGILWMMHVRGPDDIYPAPDYETAVAWCDYVNDVLAKAVPEVMTKAVPAIWTGTPESHADGLPEAIKGWTLPAAPTGDAK
jgi:hypothetical protein